MKQPGRIVLVDACAFMRRSIRRLLEVNPELRVCAEVDGVEAALRVLRMRRPDLVILDPFSLERDALAALREIRRSFPHLPVLVLTQGEESLFAESMLRAGADGYVMKRDAPDSLLRAVEEVRKRSIFVSPAVEQTIFSRLRNTDTTLDVRVKQRRSRTPRSVAPHQRGNATGARKARPRAARVQS